jgi:hypothetical protein
MTIFQSHINNRIYSSAFDIYVQAVESGLQNMLSSPFYLFQDSVHLLQISLLTEWHPNLKDPLSQLFGYGEDKNKSIQNFGGETSSEKFM